MGSSKKVTVGYRYRMGLHMGLCHEPDAMLQINAGDRVAWAGQVTESGPIYINRPRLFGGDDREGGIQGVCDVMMGRPDQEPNAYLTEQQGLPQPAYRGFLGLVFRGLIASNNPYIKSWAVKVRSILRGWHGGTAWYEEKAPVPLDTLDVPYDGVWAYKVEPPGSPADYSSPGYDDSSWAQGPGGFGSQVPPGSTLGIGTFVGGQIGKAIWIRRAVNFRGFVTIDVYHDDGPTLWMNGELVPLTPTGNYFHSTANVFMDGDTVLALRVYDGIPGGSTNIFAGMAFTGGVGYRQAMNPAHMIYQALTDPDWGMGYPADTIDADSFAAAADALYSEGLGLCVKWNSQTTIQEFTQIVADHASLVYGQDRRTGKFRMLLLRNDYNEADLPVFTRHDVKVIRYQRPSLADTVNEVIVEYVDSNTGKDATTAPLQNLANIQGQGRVVSQTLSFSGIPTHALATRVGMRELQARSTPLWRFSLEAKRRFAELLPGEPFVLDLLDTDIGVRLVMRAGDIDYGEPADGVVRAECVEDVFAMPETTYIGDPGEGGEQPDVEAQVGPSTVFEAPYTELAQGMGAAELDALPLDAGYVAAAAVRPPGVPLNFALYTRLGADDYEEASIGDFAPGAMLSEGVPAERGPTVLKLQAATRLDLLNVGGAALLGNGNAAEMVRIDAVDIPAAEVTVGRGCGDTVPGVWPMGTRLWGIDVEGTADPQQYVDGETIDAKVVNRTASDTVELVDAPTTSITMASRQGRPYPPGWLYVQGEPVPPPVIVGDVTVSWAHRDRKLQADTLVDTSEPSVGPEPGTTYTVRWILNGTLVHTDVALATDEVTWSPTGGGILRVEVESVRDSLVSWQFQAVEFPLGSPLLDESGDTIDDETDDPIIME